MAAALSGATLSQLRHWRKPKKAGEPLLVPEVSSVRPILYSFRDIIALRTFVRLRQRISLQKIRRALKGLKATGAREHLSCYQLVTDGRTVLLLDERALVDLVQAPGQKVIPLLDILEPFDLEGVRVPDLLRPRERLIVDPEVRGGKPVIEGTRVPFDVIAGLMEDGVPPAEISEYYPSVTPEAAKDAADFASYVKHYRERRRAA